MPKKIQWQYMRTSCETCKKAQAYLKSIDAQPADETVNATKIRMGETDALALAKTVDKIVAAKGKNVVTLDVKNGSLTNDDILAVLIGPTGNLRAPTLRVGKTLLVGFHNDAYAKVVG